MDQDASANLFNGSCEHLSDPDSGIEIGRRAPEEQPFEPSSPSGMSLKDVDSGLLILEDHSDQDVKAESLVRDTLDALDTADSADTQAAAIYQELSGEPEPVEMRDGTLYLVCSVLSNSIAATPSPLPVLDALWFSGSKGDPLPGRLAIPRPQGASVQQICLPIHHDRPQHWTLAVLHLSADIVKCQFYDSLRHESRRQSSKAG